MGALGFGVYRVVAEGSEFGNLCLLLRGFLQGVGVALLMSMVLYRMF